MAVCSGSAGGAGRTLTKKACPVWARFEPSCRPDFCYPCLVGNWGEQVEAFHWGHIGTSYMPLQSSIPTQA